MSEWISINDRLPERMERVVFLLQHPRYVWHIYDGWVESFYKNGNPRFQVCAPVMSGYKITHWMTTALPEVSDD